ncbi:MAG TPA: methyltransferase domain-containing protein [Burkholderiaceae bacterium]
MANDEIRESYDRIAAAYGDHFAGELQHKPRDRELLSRFAGSVRGQGKVAELGCGPGHIARYLLEAGVNDIFGLDLSPAMVEEARRRNPGIAFETGDMLALQLDDASLAGIVAMYAIVNIARESLPAAFAEMWRVLQPGGRLLLSFHIGDETVHREELFGEAVALDFHFLQPDDIAAQLRHAGFEIEEIVEREPYPEVEYPSRRAYLFAARH